MTKLFQNGFILGKFLPLHKGHQYLIEYALERVETLFVVVDNISDEEIKVSFRVDWIKKQYPNVIVLTLKKPLPQSPDEVQSEDIFWDLWQRGLREILPQKIDCVFASEFYGTRLASVLDADFDMVDLQRENIPVCATQIRNNPLEHWEYIADSAKPYFCKKVCIFGPESTGKSTLTQNLAKHFMTNFVPEYARALIEKKGGDISYEDIEMIALGHQKLIDAKIESANKVLFVDTDAIITKIWSQELFGKYPKILDDIISKQNFDFYLLLDVDVPWVGDIVRFRPEDRSGFFQKCKNELESYNKNFTTISGDWSFRLNESVKRVDSIL